MSFWKEAGISYLKYATVSARALRKVLKEDLKLQAQKREEYFVKMNKWTDGKAGENVLSLHSSLFKVMLAEKSKQ